MDNGIMLVCGSIDKDEKYDSIKTICEVYTELYVYDVPKIIELSEGKNNNLYQNLTIIVQNSKLVVIDASNGSVINGIVLQLAEEKNIPTFVLNKKGKQNLTTTICNYMDNIYEVATYDKEPSEALDRVASFAKQYATLSKQKK